MTVIERIEGNTAILEEIESGKLIEVDIMFFQKNIREGDVVVKRGDQYTVDTKATALRRSQIVDRLRKMGL